MWSGLPPFPQYSISLTSCLPGTICHLSPFSLDAMFTDLVDLLLGSSYSDILSAHCWKKKKERVGKEPNIKYWNRQKINPVIRIRESKYLWVIMEAEWPSSPSSAKPQPTCHSSLQKCYPHPFTFRNLASAHHLSLPNSS